MGSDTVASIEITPVEEDGNGKITEEEFVTLIENEDFLETFNTFYYPDSRVKDARTVDSDQSMLYVILELPKIFSLISISTDWSSISSILAAATAARAFSLL